MRLTRTPSKKARIEIIPMIDTMMFLLVFFMMATLSMTIQRGITVTVPEAKTGMGQQEDFISVTITKENRLYLGNDEVSFESLEGKVRETKAERPQALWHINGDKDAFLGYAVKIMDVLRHAGIEKVLFETKEAQP